MLDRVGGGWIGLEIRAWRGRHYLTQGSAGLWFGRSARWVKAVESGDHRPSGIAARAEAVFARYAALEAYARAVQLEVDPYASGPSGRRALARAVEALRAAGMQVEDVKRLMPSVLEQEPQPSDMNTQKAEKVKPRTPSR